MGGVSDAGWQRIPTTDLGTPNRRQSPVPHLPKPSPKTPEFLALVKQAD
jgi:hypothetical protein